MQTRRRATQPGEVRDPARAAVGVRQDGDRRVRARARRARRRDRLHRRHRRRRSPTPAFRIRSIERLHRLPRDHGRARQDAAPEALRRPARGARRPRAHRRRGRARRRARRPRVREPLPVRAHRRAPRRRRARGDREHRHRRADDDPRGGEELRVRRAGGRRPRATTRSSRSCATADGRLSLATRESLAAEAFAYTARYDTAIARWFSEKRDDFPPLFVRAFEKVTDLSYGENPHQRAAYYAQVGARTHVLSNGRASSAASSCRSTTCSTSTPRACCMRRVRAARRA